MLSVSATLCAVSACAQEPSQTMTSVRLAVVYDEAWGLDEFDLVVGTHTAQHDVSTALTILIPDAWAGAELAIHVDGVRAGATMASGDVKLTPVLHEEVTLPLVLVRLGANNTLSVVKTGTGVGTVIADIAGIACGADCSESYPSTSTVALTASPDPGSTFVGWTGACAGTGSCMVAMTEARTATAQFSCGHGFVTFNYTGSPQVFSRPSCVTQITVDAVGAAGGASAVCGSSGGGGGRTEASIEILPSDSFTVRVGGTGGWNGGGAGAVGNRGSGGSGGGASDLRRNGSTLSDRVIVAGGGGGTTCFGGTHGGQGGGLLGGGGVAGGNQVAGGVGNSSDCIAPGAQNGSAGTGGAGCNYATAECTTCPTQTWGGGGGGGGYFGGGGGGGDGGNGGGSSYAIPTATAVTHTRGFSPTDGKITISW